MKKILIIEDEATIAQLIRLYLEQANFQVLTAGDGVAGLELHARERPDLVILDLMLPVMDGMEVCRRIRAWANTPILMLTARQGEEDRIAGLELGADDYLVKPFAIEELIARKKALLRRPGGALGMTLEAGNISFDTVERDVRIGETPLVLPRRESAILEHLMRRLGRVVAKTVLEEKLYALDDEHGSNTIPVHVHHLRRKLLDAGATAEIHTVRGVGYILTESSV